MRKSQLDQRLKEISRVIPFHSLLNRKAENKVNIAKYYKLNRLAYRLINSKQGFVHMGISRDGVFKDADFLEHAHIISRYIENSKATNILELAAGTAATTKHLANKYEHINFIGLDLPNGQLDIRTSQYLNLQLVEGDYHDLSQFASNSFDLVYIIEALCHASSKRRVIREVERILKPKGILIIFDGYASKDRSLMTNAEELVSDLTYTSMMVTKEGHLYRDLHDSLLASCFKIIEEENLSQYILPSMNRLELKAAKYFKHPKLAKLLNKIIPPEVTGNTVAAYLMPLCVSGGIHQYWLTVASKKQL